MTYLDIPRGQLDRMIGTGREEEGRLMVPHRHTDNAGPVTARCRPNTRYNSGACRKTRATGRASSCFRSATRPGNWSHRAGAKATTSHRAVVLLLAGHHPDYPQQILDCQWTKSRGAWNAWPTMTATRKEWDVHHWQEINPVHTEALVQLTCGGPQIIYHGGLLHVRLRLLRCRGTPPRPAA